tara:strand:+ start:14369 stop:14515 length:147 start_codon:yes stop_codon:yes gene_type:complete
VDKVSVCPICKHEIESHECESCAEVEAAKKWQEKYDIDNYVDNLLKED